MKKRKKNRVLPMYLLFKIEARKKGENDEIDEGDSGRKRSQ